jgi:hypothetical protein
VADEVNGAWHNAIEVPGTAALNTGDDAAVKSVSCPTAGNCAAGGKYCVDLCSLNSNNQAFVANEVNGTWGTAIEVPGTAALNTDGFAQVISVSCGSAGNCAAGGFYTESSVGRQAFVVSEVNGAWGSAIEVPGIAALHGGGIKAEADSVSCASAGNCAVGGNYTDSSGSLQAFVADEVNGTWSNAIEVPSTAALNTSGNARVRSVSCPSAGNCSAGGDYTNSSLGAQAFVVSEVNGTWHTAIAVPGLATLSHAGTAHFDALSCGAVANCSAGGFYDFADNAANEQAFLVSER